MKNQYVKPLMEVEEFLANSYCSNCGKTVDGDYLFTCDYPASSDLYLETNGIPGLQRTETKTLTCGQTESNGYWEGGWGGHWVSGHKHGNSCYTTTPADTKSKFRSYHPCGETHKTSSMTDFVDGYVNGNLVTVWTQGSTNFHATSHVPQEHWTIEKS